MFHFGLQRRRVVGHASLCQWHKSVAPMATRCDCGLVGDWICCVVRANCHCRNRLPSPPRHAFVVMARQDRVDGWLFGGRVDGLAIVEILRKNAARKMSNENLTMLVVQILTALATLGALVPVYFKMRGERKHDEASAAERLSQAAATISTQWEKRVVRLECQVTERDERIENLERSMRTLERTIVFWQDGCRKLIRQLCDAGMVPVWTPDEQQKRKDG